MTWRGLVWPVVVWVVACAPARSVDEGSPDAARATQTPDGGTSDGGVFDASVADAAVTTQDAGMDPPDAATAAPDAGAMSQPDAGPGLPDLSNCPRARVTVMAGNVLNVRPDPSTSGTPLATLDPGALVNVTSAVHGESISNNSVWLLVSFNGAQGYAFSGYLACTLDEPPVAETCPRIRVTVASGATLNVRGDPSTVNAPVAQLANARIVDVLAVVHGESVNGVDVWYQVAFDGQQGFVHAGFAQCTTDEPPAPPDGFYLPIPCGTSARISQGNNGTFSHNGRTQYAYDFSLGLNRPLVAMAAGTVLHIYDQTGPGDACYDGGPSSCFPYANLVVLLHGDGTTSIYKHLNRVDVALGQVVARGAQVGLSGSTGYSTGPHAHVMRQVECGAANCQSLPLRFVDVAGSGVPATGTTVTSQNCP